MREENRSCTSIPSKAIMKALFRQEKEEQKLKIKGLLKFKANEFLSTCHNKKIPSFTSSAPTHFHKTLVHLKNRNFLFKVLAQSFQKPPPTCHRQKLREHKGRLRNQIIVTHKCNFYLVFILTYLQRFVLFFRFDSLFSFAVLQSCKQQKSYLLQVINHIL